jgi:hypothetical protein
MVYVGMALGLAALPALAANTVTRGIDVFETKGDGTTYADVSVPAGFFCAGSAAFSGTVVMAGDAVATSPDGALGHSDTVVERLADTTFDASGNATVNAIVRAASFKSASPIAVSGCAGSAYWDVKSNATPTQSTFAMTLHRSSSTATGGTFDSDVTISPRLTFTQQGSGVQRTLDEGAIHFTTSGASWTHQPGSGGVTYTAGPVQIDTNGDGAVDTTVPPTSNFAAGWSTVPQSGCATAPCPVPIPHSATTARHHVNPPPPYCASTSTTGATAKRVQGKLAVRNCYLRSTFETVP